MCSSIDRKAGVNIYSKNNFPPQNIYKLARSAEIGKINELIGISIKKVSIRMQSCIFIPPPPKLSKTILI